MRYVEMVMLLLCIHVSMAVMNAGGIYMESRQPSQEWFDSFNIDLKDDEYMDAVADDQQQFSFGDFIKALALFAAYFGLGVLVVPYTLTTFGLTMALATLISIPIYALYALAIIQIISKDGFRGKY